VKVDAKFPFLNVPFFKEFFLRLKWDSLRAIKTLPASLPILFMSSNKDEIVPAAQMRALKDAAVEAAFGAGPNGMTAERKFVTFDATHNDIWAAGGQEYWFQKNSFIVKHCS
jgi:fermentation-respiration switch protein FrsA (DUF1100 family)